VQLRWQMGPTNAFLQFCGWNIDDVRIRALVPMAECLGDANFDRQVDFNDVTAALGNWNAIGVTQREGDANADAIVNFSDITATLGNWGAVCP